MVGISVFGCVCVGSLLAVVTKTVSCLRQFCLISVNGWKGRGFRSGSLCIVQTYREISPTPFSVVPKLSCSKNTESTRVDQTFPLLPDFQASKPGLPFCSYGIASGPDSLALNSPRKSVEFHHGGGEISPWWRSHSTMVEF